MEVRNRPPNTVTDVYERVLKAVPRRRGWRGGGGAPANRETRRFGNFARHVTELERRVELRKVVWRTRYVRSAARAPRHRFVGPGSRPRPRLGRTGGAGWCAAARSRPGRTVEIAITDSRSVYVFTSLLLRHARLQRMSRIQSSSAQCRGHARPMAMQHRTRLKTQFDKGS
jgi:hypothetical protein